MKCPKFFKDLFSPAPSAPKPVCAETKVEVIQPPPVSCIAQTVLDDLQESKNWQIEYRYGASNFKFKAPKGRKTYIISAYKSYSNAPYHYILINNLPSTVLKDHETKLISPELKRVEEFHRNIADVKRKKQEEKEIKKIFPNCK